MTVMGLETEFGISVGGHGPATGLHPMHWSNLLVRGYGELVKAGERWDYDTETPLSDARGFTMERTIAHPDQLTDDDTMANLVLTNGARFYVDHAHPEYSGPEVTSALDAVRWDAAGDRAAWLAARNASQRLGQPVRLHKNNTDGKGSSYGTHENYLVSRETPFHRIVVQFSGFLVSRTPIIGSGRVGIGQYSEIPGFQLSQRADFFEAEVGLETTLNRPIINTRDEPHAHPHRFRRLHVITGDANRSQFAGWLKVGTAALVLNAIEAGLYPELPELAHPVDAMHRISHDLDLDEALPLVDGSTITALELQELYASGVARLLAEQPERVARPGEAHQLLAAWEEVIDALRRDPMELSDRLDWVAKLRLLESYRRRDGVDWSAPKLALVDLQYSELDPSRSLYDALLAKGRIRRLVSAEEIESARLQPPTDTRAYFRGRCLSDFGDQVVAAAWDSVILDVPARDALLRIPMLDPLRGTKELVGEKFDTSSDVGELVTSLGY